MSRRIIIEEDKLVEMVKNGKIDEKYVELNELIEGVSLLDIMSEVLDWAITEDECEIKDLKTLKNVVTKIQFESNFNSHGYRSSDAAFDEARECRAGFCEAVGLEYDEESDE